MKILGLVKNIYAADMEIPSYADAGYSDFAFENGTLGDIFSALLPYIYGIAGIILLFMLIFGGIGLMTAAGNPDKIKAGRGRITAAIIGFFIIFVSYFIVQLVEIALGVQIL